jgi:hypothetical protein
MIFILPWKKEKWRNNDGIVRNKEGSTEGTNKKFHNICWKYTERLLKSQKKNHCKQNHCESKTQRCITTKQQYLLPRQIKQHKRVFTSTLTR